MAGLADAQVVEAEAKILRDITTVRVLSPLGRFVRAAVFAEAIRNHEERFMAARSRIRCGLCYGTFAGDNLQEEMRALALLTRDPS